MFKKHTVLIVDDDKRIRELLAKFLEKHNYIVSICANTMQAHTFLNTATPDIIILDVMMPEEDGLSFLRKIKKDNSLFNEIPVLLLSAKSEVIDKILGLKIGADDYLSKPFDTEELLLRIKSILKRNVAKLNTKQNTATKFGDFEFIFDKKILKKNSVEIELTDSEKLLLSIFSQNLNKVISRKELSNKLGFIVNERSIDVQINRLRRKIEDNEAKYLKTIRHLGYCLCE